MGNYVPPFLYLTPYPSIALILLYMFIIIQFESNPIIGNAWLNHKQNAHVLVFGK